MVEGVNALFEPSPTPRCAPSGSCAKATCCWMQWFAWPTMATSTISGQLRIRLWPLIQLWPLSCSIAYVGQAGRPAQKVQWGALEVHQQWRCCGSDVPPCHRFSDEVSGLMAEACGTVDSARAPASPQSCAGRPTPRGTCAASPRQGNADASRPPSPEVR